MAIIKRGILGGFSGRVGNVVGSSWKGISVLRVMPLSVGGETTVKQAEQRSAFSIISKFASSILTVWVKPLWDRHAQRMSGYNAFIQQNIASVKEHEELVLSDLKFSDGRLGVTQIKAVGTENYKNMAVTWDKEPHGDYQMSSDLAYALWLSVDGKLKGYSAGEVKRSAGLIEMNTLNDDSEVGDVVVLAFRREDGSLVGSSSIAFNEVG